MDKTFVFNKNNICTNPNTPISWISEGKPSMGWSFDVFTALTPKDGYVGLIAIWEIPVQAAVATERVVSCMAPRRKQFTILLDV